MLAITSLRYRAGIIKWKMRQVKKVDPETRKMLTLHGAFHPKSDIDRLQLSRRLDENGLFSCQDYIEAKEKAVGGK